MSRTFLKSMFVIGSYRTIPDLLYSWWVIGIGVAI